MGRCPDCGYTDYTKAAVRRHRRREHGFVVCTCQRTFLKTEYMEQHRRMNRIHSSGLSSFASSAGVSSLAFAGLRLSEETDLYSLGQHNLEIFLTDNIQADGRFLICCGEVINKLVRDLQTRAPAKLRPRRVIKSGSLGKGTAVKDRSDVDLILMLAEYEEVDPLLDNLSDLLRTLELYLISGTTAKHQRTTRYSVQVEVTCSSGHKHDVDILPAVDLLGLGKSPSDLYRTMRGLPADTIHEYSVTLAPLQLEIISALPPKVKNLIKLVKYWKDKKLKGKEEPEMPSFAGKQYGKANWPSSYALELVILNAWSEAGTRESFDMTRALHAVLTSLVNHRKFTIVLDKQMKYTQDMLRPRSTPYIMDPVNPYNDMYHGLVDGEAFDWNKVVPEAIYWLSQPLFAGVDNTKYIW